jgi:hypothetical protein
MTICPILVVDTLCFMSTVLRKPERLTPVSVDKQIHRLVPSQYSFLQRMVHLPFNKYGLKLVKIIEKNWLCCCTNEVHMIVSASEKESDKNVEVFKTVLKTIRLILIAESTCSFIIK